MPIFTPHYQLAAFMVGDGYSSYYDRMRFTTIDQTMALVTDLITDGKISGWSLSQTGFDPDNLEISLSAGMGIIKRFVTRTFDDIVALIPDNSITYLYAKLKKDYIGGFGQFSQLVHINYTDIGAVPAFVTGVTSSNLTRNSLRVSWDVNPVEIDISHYTIWRSLDNATYIELTDTTDLYYNDSSLTENTIYYYKIQAVDFSGNAQVVAAIPPLITTTLRDLRSPANPGFVKIINQDSSVQLLWELLSFGLVNFYEISVTELIDGSYTGQLTTNIYTVNSNQNYYVIPDLINGKKYNLELFAVSIHDVYSEGITLVGSPKENSGPPEVQTFNITFFGTEEENIEMDLSWIPTPCDPYDPYDPYCVEPVSYIIHVVENGTRVATPLHVIGEISTTVRVLSFGDGDSSIKAETKYFLTIQTVGFDGKTSKGVGRYATSATYKDPANPTQLMASIQDDKSLLVTWINSTSPVLSHNLLNIIQINISNGTETNILEDDDLDKANSYNLLSSLLNISNMYRFELVAVDIYGHASDTILYTFEFSEEESEKPEPPDGQDAEFGDGYVKLSWIQPEETSQGFSVWRTDFHTGVSATASDFSRLETLSSDIYEYMDYEVENGTTYAYFITKISFWGLESINPEDDDDYSGFFLVANPYDSDFFTQVENVVATLPLIGGHDVLLTWTESVEVTCDGYQIFRSDGNKYSFELIGSVLAGTTTFTDVNVLVQTQIYYYLVREYRNEAELFVTTSNALPNLSIQLAKVTTVNGIMTIDESLGTQLLDDVIIEATTIAINEHKHYYDIIRNEDKRINLQSNIIVSMTTNDYQLYTTTTTFSGATGYIVYINNNPITIFYEINSSENTVTFGEVIYTSGSGESIPEVTIELLGVSETRSVVPKSRIENISAHQIISGLFDIRQLDTNLSHQGRVNELLVPVQTVLTSENDFTFSFTDQVDPVTTFYDVINVIGDSDSLLAATSRGILYSNDFGSSWEEFFVCPKPPIKLFYSSSWDKYFAITNNHVYFVSQPDIFDSSFFKLWQKIPGTENVKIIRDIVEDNNGNLYISTDLGVYKLEFVTNKLIMLWKQLPAIDAANNNSFAFIYDDINNRLLLSNDGYLLASSNSGITWTLSNEYNGLKPIYDFYQSGIYLFALTNDGVWRKNLSNMGEEFIRLADLAVTKSRKMIVFDGQLYITTDEGILRSRSSDDIYLDTFVNFEHTLPQLNINGQFMPVTSLNVVDGYLMVGTDAKLFYMRDSVWINYDEPKLKIPSFYIDGVRQTLGFAYSSNLNYKNVSFDTKQSFNAVVTFTKQYSQYSTLKGGWVNQKYNSNIDVYVNKILTFDNLSVSNLTADLFSNVTLPTPSDLTSNESTALEYKLDAENEIANLIKILNETVSLETGQTLDEVISSTYILIDKALSQYYPEVRNFTYPAIISTATGVSVDVVNGIYTFTNKYNKYDILVTDITNPVINNAGDITHIELGNTFEYINSGLPSAFSRVQQSNVVKTGLLNEKKWPGEQNLLCSPVQGLYVIPRHRLWYDVLNSDVDYVLEEQNNVVDDAGLSLPFVSSAIYVQHESKVFVAGFGGILTVDVGNLDIGVVDIELEKSSFVQKLLQRGTDLYALTGYNLLKSSDYGNNWTIQNRTGLPNKLYNFDIIGNNYVIGAEDGIYYKNIEQDLWQKAVNSSDPIEIVYTPDMLFAVSQRKVYRTVNGITYINNGNYNFQINDIIKYKSMVFVATNDGLFKDDGTFYNVSSQLTIVEQLEDLKCNALAVDDDRLIIGLDGGGYCIFTDNIYTQYTDSLLDVIHKILVVNDSIWFFGNNFLKIDDLNYIIKLSRGIPG